METFDFDRLNKIVDDYLEDEETKKRKAITNLKIKFSEMISKISPVTSDISKIDKLLRKLELVEIPEDLRASSKIFCRIGLGMHNGFRSLELYPTSASKFKDVCLIVTENGISFYNMDFFMDFPIKEASKEMLEHCIELMNRFNDFYPNFVNNFTQFIIHNYGGNK